MIGMRARARCDSGLPFLQLVRFSSLCTTRRRNVWPRGTGQDPVNKNDSIVALTDRMVDAEENSKVGSVVRVSIKSNSRDRQCTGLVLYHIWYDMSDW
jgi:hypothetical protein